MQVNYVVYTEIVDLAAFKTKGDMFYVGECTNSVLWPFPLYWTAGTQG